MLAVVFLWPESVVTQGFQMPFTATAPLLPCVVHGGSGGPGKGVCLAP